MKVLVYQAIRQRDPLVEYKIEAFNMWEHMQQEIRRVAIHNIYRTAIAEHQRQISNIQEGRRVITNAAQSKPEPVRASAKSKIGRNDDCWCGSGKKYKKCHYRADMEEKALEW